METPRIGSVIDGFTLTERLPSGGMATLWRAIHPDHAGPLVMKIPILDPGADVSTIVGYETEVMVHKRLSGPHVPTFAGAGDLAAIPYIAMGFVAGERLAETMARRRCRSRRWSASAARSRSASRICTGRRWCISISSPRT